ncbi:MAG: hypothetical protein PF518_10970 [Spirochaetaceae bacterium]|nr:hypothetical protein [Spirochaetaceae bacterium]
MKDKLNVPDELKIRQEPWHETPCSKCIETHCCRNLPLTPLRLNDQSDFINLILSSCYNEIFPVLKKSGEWAYYLERDCSFLDQKDGRCTIHKAPHQSMICKSYDAHNCWYVDAFSQEKYSTMIRFNTEMIIWFEKRYKLIENKFDVDIDWEELCMAAFDYRRNTVDIRLSTSSPWSSFTLSYKKSRTDQFLFFPPYKRPENRKHFELLSFRLSFPGIFLAISDTCWAFMIPTEINKLRLNNIRREYYPAIEHKDGSYSFDSLQKRDYPHSDTGEQWIILQRSDLEMLKNLTTFDSEGRVRKIPAGYEILNALKSRNPVL